MGKRLAEKQLTQLNQHEDDMEGGGGGGDDYGEEGFLMANKTKMSQRVIKKPKSRLRGAAAAAATPGSAGEQTTSAGGAFSGFAGFGSFGSAAASNDSATNPTTGTSADTPDSGSGESTSKGLFKGFSFTPTPPVAATAANPALALTAKPISTAAPSFSAAGSFGGNKGAASSGAAFGTGLFSTISNDASKQPAAATSFTSAFATKPAAADSGASGSQMNIFGFAAPKPAPTAAAAAAAPEVPSKTTQTGLEEGSAMDTDSKPAGGVTMPAFKPPTLMGGASAATTTSSSSLFGGTQKQSSSFSTPFVPPKPAASASASPAAASLFSNPSGFSAATTTAQESSAVNEEEFYKNIRGLNVSLQKKIDDAVAANAFVDLTPLLEQYTSHWNKVTKSRPSSATIPAKDTGTQNNNSSSGAFVPASSPFGLIQMSTKGPNGRSKPTMPAKSPTRFTFSSRSPKPISGGVNLLSPAFNAEKNNTSGASNVDGDSAMTTPPKQPPPPASGPFKFGATNNSDGPAAGFAFTMGKPPVPQQPSMFASPRAAGAAAAKASAAKKPFSFGFLQAGGGGTSATASSISPSAASATKPVFSFGFGNATSSTKESDTKDSGSGNAAGGNKEATAGDRQAGGEEEGEGGGSDADEQASTPTNPSTAGEEGEKTEHQVRAKVYMWDGGENKYKDMGVGQFKVNTWETDTTKAKRARLLCRQEGSNKITLNASLFKEMIVEYTDGKKELGLLVIVDGKPTRYLIRTSSPATTATLHECVERVKSSL
ncbi:hypothetical protein IWW48_002261 [Coemansia sp. RSA 1200]|nr:hypothetical protein IWW48_002261 [Coemansia sp. RSA 1200]